MQRGLVRERKGLVGGIEAGMDQPLVRGPDLGDARALRLGAEAAEHQDIPLASIEVGNGRAVGAAGEKYEGSLPSPPIRVFAPRLTSVSAPLLPVPVSPEPFMYIASTLVGSV